MRFKQLTTQAKQRALQEVYDQAWDMQSPVTEEEAELIADGYLYDEMGECIGRRKKDRTAMRTCEIIY